MFFKKIAIENFGAINSFQYESRLNEEGNPVPMVLVGKNGSGKTLLLASLVDNYIEAKKIAYPSSIGELNDISNFYKVLSPSYIKHGSYCYSIHNLCSFGDNDYDYYELETTTDTVKDELRKNGWCEEALNNLTVNKNAFKLIMPNSITAETLRKEIFIYFPIGRSSSVLWNNQNNKTYWYDASKISGKADDSCIMCDLFTGIEQYLKDLFLDNYANLETKRSRIIFDNITKIICSIKKEDIGNFYVNERRDRELGFRWGNNGEKGSCLLSQLSSGELSIFSMAVNIMKVADLFQTSFDGNLNDIIGTVIIDECDMNLHINMQYDQFPTLMQLFPKIQFIISTHSPFILAGLKKAYKSNIDFLIMPDGVKIDNINQFEEVVNAYSIFNKETENILLDRNLLIKEIENVKNESNKIFVFTEGKTDAILISKAMQKLSVHDLNDVVISNINCAANNESGSSQIVNLLNTLVKNPKVNNNIVIGLFDHDKDEKLRDCNGKEKSLFESEIVEMSEKIFAFAIPVPHNRPQQDQISIEHYFTDNEITRCDVNGMRLFLGNEFYPTGVLKDETKQYYCTGAKKICNTIKIIEHEYKQLVTDLSGVGDYSLSKSMFANYVAADEKNFNDFNFNEFNKIFDIIRKILKIKNPSEKDDEKNE